MAEAVSASAVTYQPEVIERHAERLLERAHRFHRVAIVVGALLGTAAGVVPLLRLDLWPLPSRFALAPVLVGVVAGGFIGHAVGRGRAELLRLHAQMVLCQLHGQRATLAIWKAVRELPLEPARQQIAVAAPVEEPEEPEAEPLDVQVVPPLTAPLLRLPTQATAAG